MTPEQTLELLAAVQGIAPALENLASAIKNTGFTIAFVIVIAGGGIMVLNR